jgi:hypothetical protein
MFRADSGLFVLLTRMRARSIVAKRMAATVLSRWALNSNCRSCSNGSGIASPIILTTVESSTKALMRYMRPSWFSITPPPCIISLGNWILVSPQALSLPQMRIFKLVCGFSSTRATRMNSGVREMVGLSGNWMNPPAYSSAICCGPSVSGLPIIRRGEMPRASPTLSSKRARIERGISEKVVRLISILP